MVNIFALIAIALESWCPPYTGTELNRSCKNLNFLPSSPSLKAAREVTREANCPHCSSDPSGGRQARGAYLDIEPADAFSLTSGLLALLW